MVGDFYIRIFKLIKLGLFSLNIFVFVFSNFYSNFNIIQSLDLFLNVNSYGGNDQLKICTFRTYIQAS